MGHRKPFYSVAGVIIGVLALGLTIFHFFAAPLEPAPTLKSSLVELAQLAKGAIADAVRQETASPSPLAKGRMSLDLKMIYGTVALGILAISCGLCAMLRREEPILRYLAMTLGGSVIIWQASLMAAGIILVIVALLIVIMLLNGVVL
ncbi:MAG: hypothetical protein ACRC5A_15135 [Enterobacteriaceae bacterium]